MHAIIRSVLLASLAGCTPSGNPGTPLSTPPSLQPVSPVAQIQAGWQRYSPALTVLVLGLEAAKKISPATGNSIIAVQAQITTDVASLSLLQNPTTPATIQADLAVLNGAFTKAVPGDAAWAALADELAGVLLAPASSA
jgi:hypothetical protein